MTTAGESGETTIEAPLRVSGTERLAKGVGNGPIAAFVDAVRRDAGILVAVLDYHEHAIGGGADASAVAYVEVKVGDSRPRWGVGIHGNIVTASLRAVVSGTTAWPDVLLRPYFNSLCGLCVEQASGNRTGRAHSGPTADPTIMG